MNTEILTELHYLEDKILQYQNLYNVTDIRISLLDSMHTSLSHYLIKRNYINDISFLSSYKAVYKKVTITNKLSDQLKINAINSSNSNLIVEYWSNFELFISYLTESIFDKETKRELMESDYNDIVKSIKKLNVDVSSDKFVQKRIYNEFYLVPSSRKIDKLLSRLKTLINQSDDKRYIEVHEFLKLFGKLRNCVHSNFIYHGNACQLAFNKVIFNFEPNKPIQMIPPNDLIFLNMIVELRKIGELLIDLVKHDEIIYDPTHEVVEYK